MLGKWNSPVALLPRPVVVAALGTTQTLAWASSYYLPAIIARDIAEALAVSQAWVFGIFSASLVLSALLGPAVGRMIDRRGGAGVLIASNLLLAGGLLALAICNGLAGLTLAWALLGVGMALGLYDAAFATLASLYGRDARGPITGITLFAGFASTVGWPLTAFLDAQIGWRGACVVWAVMHLVIGLPLNVLLVPRSGHSASLQRPQVRATWKPRRQMFLLAYIFAASWFVTGAMAAHLPALLQIMGASTIEAVAASALVGPAQVAARVAEFVLMRRIHPLWSARLAASLHPAGAVIVGLLGASAAAIFALLHGAGNGLLTIARGTLPLALFGPHGYGARTGLLGAPSRMAQAAAPLVFGLLLDRLGSAALLVSAGLCLTAFAALFLVGKHVEIETPEAEANAP